MYILSLATGLVVVDRVFRYVLWSKKEVLDRLVSNGAKVSEDVTRGDG